MKEVVNIWWCRRDLRLEDNAALGSALRAEGQTLPIFIFDKAILDALEDEEDARVSFIHQEIAGMKQALQERGSDMWVHYGTAQEAFALLLEKYQVNGVYVNEDYEPYAIARDEQIKRQLEEAGVRMHLYTDQLIMRPDAVLKDNGEPYGVYTPYSKAWQTKAFRDWDALTEDKGGVSRYSKKLLKVKERFHLPGLEEMGFAQSRVRMPSKILATDVVRQYAEKRNYPGIRGTTRLGVHLRFGTISIRQLAREARELSSTYLNELIWREFYAMILYQHPRVVHEAYRTEYDNIKWRDDAVALEKWQLGKTGYPLVDAGMRELNATGFMHNRVRMVVASFLCKHLLIDWRQGEAYFARKLLDFDLSSNNGGWQWAAGCGTDAAPYFRVFNPELQMKKFDPKLEYVKQWVPEWQELSYAKPIVDHKVARDRCLEEYKAGIARGKSRL